MSTTAATDRTGKPITTTGRVLSREAVRENVPGVIMGDRAYAEVNSAWLREWYGTFRSELFRLGIVKWDDRFDCNRFADVYAGMAQAWFFRETFHSNIQAQALALGPFWYQRADGSGGHAVIQVLTERGRVFIDPQTGREVELSVHERMSAFLQYF
ncbi:MAG: hypothetical protein NVV63_06135 [Opitutus sp.]|nr:hypothetical protein [Opitutus sp.]